MNEKTKTNKLPGQFKKYFWDCDFENLNLKQYSFFIIERVLNYGNIESIRWLLLNVDEEALLEVVRKSRNIDKKTRNYWKIMLDE